MLIGKKTSCLGVIFGIFLATLLISQQSAIFLGLMARSYRVVTDTPEPTIWVVDASTESEDKLRSMPLSYLNIVRATPGIDWAVPMDMSLLPIVTPAGKFEISQIYGVDDATLIGAPLQMIQGSILDLRREGGVIVDTYSAKGSLATIGPDGTKHPIQIGQTLEVNGKRAVVVGICQVTQNFYPQPIMFTSFTQFQVFTPGMTDKAGYILAKTSSDADTEKICSLINAHAGLRAYTREQFKDLIMNFFLKTGILINFGLSVVLGIIIGFSISGQIFYMITMDNINYYALIKAVGGTGKMVLQMIIFQAALVGLIGFSLGIGATVLWGLAIKNTTLAFLFPWQLLVFTGVIIFIICIFTAVLSIQKVFRTDPKMLMGT